MTMHSHDSIREQLTDHVLGELSKADRARVEAHLAECAECAAEARELSLAFQGIGLAEEPTAPPPHLRTRVLDRLAREPRPFRPVQRAGGRGRTPKTAGMWWLGAAAAVLLIALGGLLVRNNQRTGQLARDLSQAREEIARLTENAQAVEGQADLVLAVLTSPDMRRIDLAGLGASQNTVARAYWSATRGLLIVADQLPTPPPGRIYQVWLIGSQSTGPVSAGLIDPGTSGRGMLSVPPPGGVLGGGVTIAVTDEPPGGLPAPTGSKHLLGSV